MFTVRFTHALKSALVTLLIICLITLMPGCGARPAQSFADVTRAGEAEGDDIEVASDEAQPAQEDAIEVAAEGEQPAAQTTVEATPSETQTSSAASTAAQSSSADSAAATQAPSADSAAAASSTSTDSAAAQASSAASTAAQSSSADPAPAAPETWADLQKKIDGVQAGDTIKLEQDYQATTDDTCLRIAKGKDVTLDLNGHKLDRGLAAATDPADGGSAICVDGKLALVDTSEGHTGLVTGGFAAQGGGIYVRDAAYLKLEGVAVRGNRASDQGGGVYVAGKQTILEHLEMTGSVDISGNEASVGPDLFLQDDWGCLPFIKVTGSLQGAHVGVKLSHTSDTFTLGFAQNNDGVDPATCFFVSGDENMGLEPVLTSSGEVELASTWNGLQTMIDAAATGDTIKLERDYVAAPCDTFLDIAMDKDITIDLNGHKIDRGLSQATEAAETGNAIVVGGKLALIDTSEGHAGIITGGYAPDGGGVYVHNKATLVLGDVSVTGNKASDVGGGIFVEAADGSCGSLELAGAANVSGNEAPQGPDLFLQGQDGTLPLVTVTAPLEGAHVNVALSTGAGAFTKGFAEHSKGVEPAAVFSADAGHYVVADQAGEASVAAKSASLPQYSDPFVPAGQQMAPSADGLDGGNWMSGISGERYLNEINLPCTHDSGAKEVEGRGAIAFGIGEHWAQTQVRYIDEQLTDGVRKLDVRLNNWHETDDGYETQPGVLWLCHGKSSFGTFWCQDHDGNDLTLTTVLDWVKAFLAEHPTETVVMDFEAELNDNDGFPSEGRLEEDKATVWQTAHDTLQGLAAETNPSTGKPYLYLEQGQTDISTLFSACPQLKDCRGQLVIKHSSDTVGGLDWGHVGIDEKSENANDIDGAEKIKRVNKFYEENESIQLARDATTHMSTIYNVGTTTAGNTAAYTGGHAPVDYADDVHNGCRPGEAVMETIETASWVGGLVGRALGYAADGVRHLVTDRVDGLFESGSVYDQRGRYVGWVRLDGATPEVDAMIWQSNFPDDLQRRAINVMAGRWAGENPAQSFTVLAGTQIALPECGLAAPEGSAFAGWKVEDGSTSQVMQPGEAFTVADDVTFTATWTAAQ